MKRAIIPALLLLLCSASELDAFMKARHDWWKIRMKGLVEEKKSLEKNASLDPALVELVKHEIGRAEAMLALFDRTSRNDPTLRHEKRVFSATEIREQAGRTVPPLFSLYFLEQMLDEPGRADTALRVRSAAKEYLAERLLSDLGSADGALLESIIEEDISRQEWQYICLETTFLRMLAQQEELMARSMALIEQKAAQEAASLKSPITLVDLRDIIIRTAQEHLGATIARGDITLSREILNESWSWRNVLERCAGDFAHYKGVRSMLEAEGIDAPLARIRKYCKDVPALERCVFEDAEKRYLRKKSTGSNGYTVHDTGSNTLTLNIPRDVDGVMLFKDINALRRSAAAAVNGGESEEYYRELENKFRSLLVKHTGEAQTLFTREEEKERQAREKNSGLIVLNAHDFNMARDLFNDKAALVRGYISRSVDFIRWASGVKRTDPGKFMESFASRMKQNMRFVSSLRSLMRDSAAVGDHESPLEHQRFAHCVKRLDDIFRAIGYTTGIEKKDLRFFTAAHRNEIRNRRSEFADSLRLARQETAAMYAGSRKRSDAAARSRAAARENIQGSIAQQEILYLVEKIDSSMLLYKRLNHAESAFRKYSDAFNGLQEPLGKKSISEGLDHTIKARSIIPLVEDFKAERIRREHGTKEYLRRETGRDLARLAALLSFYRKKSIELKDKPAEEYSGEIQNRLKERPSVMVASWRMNEMNFEEVDRKAVEKLARERNRVLWQRSPKGTGTAEHAPVLDDGMDPGLTFSIPEGWVRRDADSSDARRGVIASFSSQDMKASVVIALVERAGRTAQEVAARWASDSGTSIIRQRWGKRDDRDYFWAVSRGGERSVTEIYAFTRGDDVLILSGSSPKDRYAYFRNKFTSVFNSLKE